MRSAFCTVRAVRISIFFFFNDTATTEIYTLSLHDALPIFVFQGVVGPGDHAVGVGEQGKIEVELLDVARRSEEHTSELQSQSNLVCRLLLEKKKKKKQTRTLQRNNQDHRQHLRAPHSDSAT